MTLFITLHITQKEVSYAQHLFDPKIHQKQQFCEITLQLKVLVFIVSYL